MGSYLPTPNIEKESATGYSKNKKVGFGVSAMQGWRNTMEDSHICSMDIAEGVHFFGVYDGHGGHEVAEFVKEHLISELKNL
jgi:serine/threonine protein phosphatase PrpC